MERQWSQDSFCFILNSLCVISNNSEFRVREYWYLTDYHLRKENNLAWRWTCAKIWKWSTTFVETCDQYPFSLAASSLLVSLFYEARQEKFGDTKGVIRRQRTNYELQSTIQKTTDWATWIPLNITGETSNCPEV
jgi:hypothetical protein